MIRILLVIFIASCSSTGEVVTEYDTNGVPYRKTQFVNSKEFQETERVKAAEQSNAEYFKAQAEKYKNIGDGRDIALITAIEALAGNKAPTNYNDSEIAKTKASVEKHKTWSGFGSSLIWGGVSVVGIKEAGDVLSDMNDNQGVKIEGNDNEIRGTNTAENGSSSYSNNEPITNTTTIKETKNDDSIETGLGTTETEAE